MNVKITLLCGNKLNTFGTSLNGFTFFSLERHQIMSMGLVQTKFNQLINLLGRRKIGHCSIVLFLNNVADLALELGENNRHKKGLLNFSLLVNLTKGNNSRWS